MATLISALEVAGQSPTIARNHEDYPNFGNDLDLFLCGALEQTKQVFTTVAQQIGWDLLTLCSHYTPYRRDALCIPVFRFHHLNPAETLQVDLFGGFVLQGLTLADRQSLCGKRQKESQGRFHHLEPAMENGYRIFQVASLHPVEQAIKINRYRTRVLDFDHANPGRLQAWGKQYLLGDLGPALAALRHGEWANFYALIKRAKRHFVAARMIVSPFLSVTSIWLRYLGLRQQMYNAPCGPELNLAGDSGAWRSVLDRMTQEQFLPGWTEDEPRKRERGLALVNWDQNGISFTDTEQAFEALVSLVLRRHEVLVDRTDTSP